MTVQTSNQCSRVGVKSFENLDFKDLNSFLQKKDFGFLIDLNPFVLGQNPSAF